MTKRERRKYLTVEGSRQFRKINVCLTEWYRKHVKEALFPVLIIDRLSQQDVIGSASLHSVRRRRQKAALQGLPSAGYSSGLVCCVFVLIADMVPRGLCSIWVRSDLQLECSVSQEIPETDKQGHQQGSCVDVKQQHPRVTHPLKSPITCDYLRLLLISQFG